MKKVILAYLMVSSFCFFAQDTLFFRNGTKEVAKISEINTKEVKFKKTNNLEGPSYSELKSNIAFIKYANGTTDSIKQIAEVKIVEPTIVPAKQSLMYSRISDRELMAEISMLPSSSKKNKMLKEYALMKQFQRNQYLANGLGFGIGFAVPVVCTYYGLSYGFSSSYNNATDPLSIIVVGALAGAAIRITGQVITKVNKNKRLNARKNIMMMYDELN